MFQMTFKLDLMVLMNIFKKLTNESTNSNNCMGIK